MEPIGLGIGIVGLAGLFTACLDAIDRAKAYRSFAVDADVLAVQFSAQRLRLEQWGHDVGLQGSDVAIEHHPCLDQQQTRESVSDLLRLVNSILDSHGAPKPLSRRSTALTGDRISDRLASKGQRLGWALGGKGATADQLKLLGDLVDLLYGLVPPSLRERGTSASPSQPLPDWLDVLRQVIADQQAEKRRQINAWILGQHHQNRWDTGFWNDRISGTCEWILDRRVFKQWVVADGIDSSKPQILWIHGGPGFGKTFLCSRIVQHLLEHSGQPVASYFMSSDYGTVDDPYTIVRSWISQLCSHTAHVFDLVNRKWQATSDQTATRLAVMDILRDIARDLPRCFLVVDGLDECSAPEDSNHSISRFLADVKSILGPSARLLVVSREMPAVREALRSTNDAVSMDEYRITPEDVQQDIADFSCHIVDRKLAKRPKDFRADLATNMASRCAGQFQWVKVQESYLTAWKSSKQLHAILEKTPKKLEDVYERDWKKILASDRSDRAINLLRWAAFAARPLAVGELAEAALINEDSEGIPTEELPDAYSEEYLHEEILALCGPLIEVRDQQDGDSTEDWTIHLSHFTVKQFLLGRLPIRDLGIEESLRLSNEQLQHTFLARQCLLYIQYPQTWVQKEQDPSQPAAHSAFRAYSAQFWDIHLHQGVELSQDPETDARIVSFLDDEHPAFRPWASWIETQNDDEKEVAEKEAVRPIPAYYALVLDLDDVAIRLIRKSGLGERAQERIRHPLVLSCDGDGKPGVLRAILECGADVNAQDVSGYSALCTASIMGHMEIVEILLEQNARVDLADHDGWLPIHFASHLGFLDIVRALVERGADISAATPSQNRTPVQLAAFKGHLSVTEFLLERGASLDADSTKYTALHFAAVGGHLEMIEFLLENGASLEAADVEGRTPLLLAASAGHLDAVTYLSEKGARVDPVENDGLVPLHYAAIEGHLDVARYLVQSGTSLNIANSNGITPLHFAVLQGHLEVAEYFVERGANLNAVDGKDGYTPLHFAVRTGSLGLAECLINNGADLNATNCKGVMPLHMAASCGEIQITRLLVETGGCLEAVDSDNQTPLWWAAIRGHSDVVKYLVSKGARLNSPGQPVLHAAASAGHLDTLDLLMDLGASLDSINSFEEKPLDSAIRCGRLNAVKHLLNMDATIAGIGGESLLHVAARYGQLEVLEYLANTGTDLCIVDTYGQTPVHAAARAGQVETLKRLMALGASSDTLNIHGATPLGSAIAFGQLEVVRHMTTEDSNLTTACTLGEPPLHWAICTNQLEILKHLAESRIYLDVTDVAGFTPLHVAANLDRFDMVRHLVEKGGDLEAKDGFGRTPLHHAAGCGWPGVTTYLIDKGANVEAENSDGKTPLYLAATSGHIDVVEVLVENEASLFHAEREHDWAPVHAAICNGHIQILDLAVAKGSVVQVIQHGGSTEVFTSSVLSAAAEGHQDMIRHLRDVHGLRLGDVIDTYGRSLIFHAARHGRVELVQFLLADGVDPSLEDWCRSTALFAAVANGHADVARLLIDHGVSLENHNRFGRPLTYWARKAGSAEILDILQRHGCTVTEYGAEEEENEASEATLEPDGGRCDGCTLTFADAYLYCGECPVFRLCKECFIADLWCPIEGHGKDGMYLQKL